MSEPTQPPCPVPKWTAQIAYNDLRDHNPVPGRGINGPLFLRKHCGGANMSGVFFNQRSFQEHGVSKRAQQLLAPNVPGCAPWQTLTRGSENIESEWPQPNTDPRLKEPALNVPPPPPPARNPHLYDSKGNLFRSKFAKHHEQSHHLRCHSSLSLTHAGREGSVSFQPGFAAALTIGRSKQDLKRTIDPKSFQTRKSGKGQTALPKPRRFYYPEQLDGSQRPHVPDASTCLEEGRKHDMEARERLSRLDFVTHNAAHVITKGSHCTKTSPKQDSTRQAGTFAKSMIPKNRRQKSWKHHETDEPDVTLERMREEDIASILQGRCLDDPARVRHLAKMAQAAASLPKPAATPPPQTPMTRLSLLKTRLRKYPDLLVSMETQPRQSLLLGMSGRVDGDAAGIGAGRTSQISGHVSTPLLESNSGSKTLGWRARTALSGSRAEETLNPKGRSCSANNMLVGDGVPQGMYKLDSQEREAMVEALKDEWEQVNKEYQRITFTINWLDSVHKVRKKEKAEQRLAELEAMIASLSTPHVFVT